MALRHVRVSGITLFAYGFGGNIEATMADIGRAMGSQSIGLAIQTVPPGNRFRHEVCLYPDEGVAFVEGLGAEVPLAGIAPSDWTEERRKR